MIRIDLTRQDANHPDRRKRHPSRASCEAGDRRYEATGPAPIYRLVTLLWLHGHGDEHFEVWDDRSPSGKLGGLAMRGQVRNWARLVKDEPIFTKDAPPEADFSPETRNLVARAAGRVTDLDRGEPPQPENGRTARSHLLDGPEQPPELEGPSASIIGPQATEAA